jgi:hypothetical protein
VALVILSSAAFCFMPVLIEIGICSLLRSIMRRIVPIYPAANPPALRASAGLVIARNCKCGCEREVIAAGLQARGVWHRPAEFSQHPAREPPRACAGGSDLRIRASDRKSFPKVLHRMV